MRRLISICALILITQWMVCQEPSVETVALVADDFIGSHFPQNSYRIADIESYYSEGARTIFVLSLYPEGWLIMSADMGAEAVLGFSWKGRFDDPSENPGNGCYYWIGQYSCQVKQIKALKSTDVHPSWMLHKTHEGGTKNSLQDIRVDNLIGVEWDQSAGWNRFCPEDPAGPGGHAYAGCVAVSMAQALSAFMKPDSGKGTHTYSPPNYSQIFVDFGATGYKWDSMAANNSDKYNSLIIYHCAVGVDMEFGPDASGSTIIKASSAMRSYFGMSKVISYKGRDPDDQKWMNMLNNELINGRPLIYAADAGDGDPGHAFNIDGVINTYYHLNWGWNGRNNGYYVINSLRPGTADFTKNHRALFGIKPFYYPTDVSLSDTIVKLNVPVGKGVGKVVVTDEAADNVYTFGLACDSTFNGTGYTKNYYLDGDSLRTGRIFTEADGNSDTITITVSDIHGNMLERVIPLRLGTPSTGIDDLYLRNRDLHLLYPNPVSGKLFCRMDETMQNVSMNIYSVTGLLMRRALQVIPGSPIDISDLLPGLYLIEVRNGRVTVSRERIIVR